MTTITTSVWLIAIESDGLSRHLLQPAVERPSSRANILRTGRVYAPEEIMHLIGKTFYLDGDLVRTKNSKRLQVFRKKGLACVACGIEGTRFYKEREKRDNRDPTAPGNHWSMMLYAVAAEGHEVLMTRDHTMPISRGGSRNDITNMQPMCSRCNNLKGDKVPEKP